MSVGAGAAAPAPPRRLGLVLSGGGARGAYQAGVLRAVAERVPPGPIPFQVLTGVSAGALNAAFLASRADDFQAATRALSDLWCTLRTEQVLRAGAWSSLLRGAQVLRNLSGGGVLYTEGRNHLLDTTPLARLVREHVSPSRIREGLERGALHAVGLTSTNYRTGSAVTHYMAAAPIRDWDSSNHVSMAAALGPEHVLASCAIPVFFPPVRVGESYHGDGALRLTAPFRAAIRLGAGRILAVHLRHRDPAESLRAQNLVPMRTISLADIGGVLLNSVFLDALDLDLDRLERINRTLGIMTEEQREHLPDPLRIIPVTLVRPSRNPGELAARHFGHLPRVLRYLLAGLGARRGRSSDLTSYLAFEATYCSELEQLGYQDATARAGELLCSLGLLDA